MTTTRSTEDLDSSRLAGSWRVDSARSQLGFLTRLAFGLIPVRGRYSGYDGDLHVEHDGDANGVVHVDTETISTGIRKRDVHLRSKDFFDVPEHPQARFELTSLIPEEGDLARLTGTLHIRGEALHLDERVTVATPTPDELRVEADFEVDPRAAGFEFKFLPKTARVHAGLTLTRAD